MTKMIFDIDNELEEEFRKAIAEKKGLHKGVIKESMEEAIKLWMKEQGKKKGDKDE